MCIIEHQNTESQGGIDESMFIVGDFNTQLSEMDRKSVRT